MQEHRQHIKRASAEAGDSWISQHEILKTLWELLRKSLMKPFMKAHLYIVLDLERIALVLR
jgi:hypothetical protein